MGAAKKFSWLLTDVFNSATVSTPEVRLVERLDAFLFQAMQNTPTELYRDAIGMIAADKLPHSAIKQANLLAETGEAFNAAVWAAIRLQEMTMTEGWD